MANLHESAAGWTHVPLASLPAALAAFSTSSRSISGTRWQRPPKHSRASICLVDDLDKLVGDQRRGCLRGMDGVEAEQAARIVGRQLLLLLLTDDDSVFLGILEQGVHVQDGDLLA